LQPGTGF